MNIVLGDAMDDSAASGNGSFIGMVVSFGG
jgi:hypothetical protein